MSVQTIDTDSPEFRKVMEDAYSKAYSYGVKDERERCEKIIGEIGLHLPGDQEEDREKAVNGIMAKIRSGE